MTPTGLGYSIPAVVLGRVNTSDAVDHGRPHAHLYAWTHMVSSCSNSFCVHGTRAAEYRNAPTYAREEFHGQLRCEGVMTESVSRFLGFLEDSFFRV